MFRMDPISQSLGDLNTTSFDVIVVGSGYGGGVSASRLARAGQNVCVLERGREILPGSYPRTLSEARKELQITTSIAPTLQGAGNGMMDLRINDDMNVIVGCGLGGTSLINANVALETDPRTFDLGAWPKVFRDDKDLLDPYYEMARKMLGSTPLPEARNPNKLQALAVSARGIGAPMERPPINVTFKDGPNAAGVMQAACNNCGDCCSGCNYGAKNTTLMNYLPDAFKHGASIVTEAKVITVLSAAGGGWNVEVEDLSDPSAPQRHILHGARVVLAAGTLGSTEIMLRSAGKGLDVSDRLGKGFSGNGDVLAFGYDSNWKNETNKKSARAPVYGIGAGANAPDQPKYQPGPCITGVIKVSMGAEDDITKAMVIEEGVAPGALSLIYPAMFLAEAALHASFTRFPDTVFRMEDVQELGNSFLGGAGTNSLADMAYSGAASRTQSFLVMSHDSSGGEIVLNEANGSVSVNWKGVGDEFPYNRDNEILRDGSDAIWANYIANPLWYKDFGRKLVTVHPVGGCCMGDDATKGVVNDACQVFTGSGTDTHEGLYICDGSVLPTSLGLNPLLTISAVSERAMDLLIRDKGWKPVGTVIAKATAPGPVAEPVTASAGGFGFDQGLAALDDAIATLNGVRERIAQGKLSDAETDFDTFVKKLLELAGKLTLTNKALLWSSLTDKEMKEDIAPALDWIVPVLAEISRLLHGTKSGQASFTDVIACIETAFGSVSPTMQFAETMAGFVNAPDTTATGAISDPYVVTAAFGKAAKQALSAHFVIHANSLEEMTARADHQADLTGEIICPMLSGEPMQIKAGTGKFYLLKQDAAEVDTWKMIYQCDLIADGGAGVHFRGVKTLKRREGSNWWHDLTTLSVDIFMGDSESGEHLAQGIISLGLQNLVAQAATFGADFLFDPKNDVLTDLFKDIVLWGDLHTELAKPEVRRKLISAVLAKALAALDKDQADKVSGYLKLYFEARFAALFGKLVFQSYGGLLAYMYDFPARAPDILPLPANDGAPLRNLPQVRSSWHGFEARPGVRLQMINYKGGEKGPVILAPGFATRAQSFVMETVDTNLVEMLCKDGFDVWLFDYRGSPALGDVSLQDFTIDDVATEDWPAGVDYVLAQTGAKSVQALVHCMGSMTCLMSVLSGKVPGIRSIISSQLTVHPVTNWFNKMKADTGLATLVRDGVPASMRGLVSVLAPDPGIAALVMGMETINSVSVVSDCDPNLKQDQVLNLLTYNVPFPNGVPCNSPTCHRIFGIYGPVYDHSQLNQATHLAVRSVFGEISTKPFEQIALMTSLGYVTDEHGKDVYLPNVKRLEIPITFIAGALNEEFLPDTSLRTYNWLLRENPDKADLYRRHVFRDYAHMDCFIGKNADRDIFPYLLAELNRQGN